MHEPMRHRSRPRLGQLPHSCNENFKENKNGKYVPFEEAAAYNRQRRRAVQRVLKALSALQ
jgi:hypothetical protein